MAVKAGEDQTVTQAGWPLGIVRDVPRSAIPPTGLFDSFDFLLDQPGKAYGRGGFAFQASSIGSNSNKAVSAVGVVPFSASAPSVVAKVNGHFYETVTASDLGASGVQPICNLPVVQTNGSQILVIPASDGTTSPKKVFLSTGTPTLGNLGGSPPAGQITCVHLSYLLLANSTANPNRLWFSPIPNVETTWDTTNAYIDFDEPITGLASVAGILCVWSLDRFWRVLGTVPPGTTGENMQVQPVASVGCQDARSIVVSGNIAYFAGSEGISYTNGAGVQSLTERKENLGISSYWRDTIAAAFTANTVIASGVFRNRWLITSVVSPGGAYGTISGAALVSASLVLPFTGFFAHPPVYLATAVTAGTAGNNITITVVSNPSGPESVTVSGSDITITVNSSTGTVGSTYVNIVANPAASALITLNASPGSGGQLSALAKTNLAGGAGSAPGAVTTLVCYLPTGAWQKFSNVGSYAYAQLQKSSAPSTLLGAWAVDACVVDHANCFQYTKGVTGTAQTDAGTTFTGGALAVTPGFSSGMLGNGPGLKAYGDGHLTYNMLIGSPTLAVSVATGLEAENGFSAVTESPLAVTTGVTRKRFTVSKDAQAVYLSVQQAGSSAYTEIYAIQNDIRPYPPEADGQ